MPASSQAHASEQDMTRERARQELIVQCIGLAALAAGVVIASWQRKMSEPDHWRQHRMRWAKATERNAARLAKWAWGHAERARVAYERERDAP